MPSDYSITPNYARYKRRRVKRTKRRTNDRGIYGPNYKKHVGGARPLKKYRA